MNFFHQFQSQIWHIYCPEKGILCMSVLTFIGIPQFDIHAIFTWTIYKLLYTLPGSMVMLPSLVYS